MLVSERSIDDADVGASATETGYASSIQLGVCAFVTVALYYTLAKASNGLEILFFM